MKFSLAQSHSSHMSERQIHYSPSLRRQDIGVLLSLEGPSPTFEIKERSACKVAKKLLAKVKPVNNGNPIW